MPPNIRLIGVGNGFRGDDAAGLIAARRLRELGLPGVTILEKSGDATELMDLWQDPGPAILIDAMRTGNPPGTVRRFDPVREPLPAASFRTPSTHSFGVAESLELARILGRLPAYLIIYGIEGKSFAAGAGLSPEVAAALAGLIPQIRRELELCGNLEPR